MEKSLIIVESPSKAKTINKYLGKDYIVEASVGHIKNLPKSKLGVDVDNDYELVYETIKGKDVVIEKLQTHAKKAKDVYLATDPDREGEAIAWHIATEIGPFNKKIHRVLFHEITETGISDAMKHPHKIDTHLVDSQQARRAMDRIVGYKISPFIWKTVYYGLSAGRVQSVTLRLICEREIEINSFLPQEYWSIIGEFSTDTAQPFLAKLTKVAGSDPLIPDETTVNGYLADIRNYQYSIESVQKKSVKRNPPPPFITSTLQQEAANRLRFSAKRTMILAQKLYEGVDIGAEGPVGLITYMRTDSTRLSKEAVHSVREYIYSNYGSDYLPKQAREYKKGKSSQDAHEAIRPTSIKHTPKSVKKYLDKEMFALYELIWNRFVASEMTPALFEQLSIDITGGDYLFRATGSVPKFRGFLQVYDDMLEENGKVPDDTDPTSGIPDNIHEGQQSKLHNLIPRQHFTKPPARYTESSLVKDLEALGIGRPSTYAMIVSTIVDRKYVDQRERKLYATDLGMEVNKLLVSNFPEIVNVQFTARMEEELDTIASGKRTYKKVLDDFYHPFIRSLQKVEKHTSKIKKSLQEVTDDVCELCGKPMIIKWGRNGRFMACSGYPACRNTKPLASEQEKHQHLAGIKCELCGGDMVVKGGPFGSFMGCSNYPTCKNTKPISMGIKCPKCKDGDIIERKTKKKRTFYGCSRYPDCDYASWDRPVIQQCQHCPSPFLVKKFSQKKGEYLKCPECKEEYSQEEAVESGT
jgi:DNA topoisomerase I